MIKISRSSRWLSVESFSFNYILECFKKAESLLDANMAKYFVCPQLVDTDWGVWQASNNVAGWLTDWVRRYLEMHSHLKGEVGEGGEGGGGADQQPGGQVGEAWSPLSWAGWWLWTTRQQKKTVVPVRIDSVRNPGFWNITRMFVLGRKVFSELWGAYYSSGRAHTEKKNTKVYSRKDI